jgi:hypothetical protein
MLVITPICHNCSRSKLEVEAESDFMSALGARERQQLRWQPTSPIVVWCDLFIAIANQDQAILVPAIPLNLESSKAKLESCYQLANPLSLVVSQQASTPRLQFRFCFSASSALHETTRYFPRRPLLSCNLRDSLYFHPDSSAPAIELIV